MKPKVHQNFTYLSELSAWVEVDKLALIEGVKRMAVTDTELKIEKRREDARKAACKFFGVSCSYK